MAIGDDMVIEVGCIEHGRTANALLVETEGRQPVWIARSLIKNCKMTGDRVTSITIPVWLAKDKRIT